MASSLNLRWANHDSNLTAHLRELVSSEKLLDVTLACEGGNLKGHRVVLAAASPFFEFQFLANPSQHPVIVLIDFDVEIMKEILQFIYAGTVEVSQERVSLFLKAAAKFKLRGIFSLYEEETAQPAPSSSSAPSAEPTEEAVAGQKITQSSSPQCNAASLGPQARSSRNEDIFQDIAENTANFAASTPSCNSEMTFDLDSRAPDTAVEQRSKSTAPLWQEHLAGCSKERDERAALQFKMDAPSASAPRSNVFRCFPFNQSLATFVQNSVPFIPSAHSPGNVVTSHDAISPRNTGSPASASSDRPLYSCLQCNKRFAHKTSLKRHQNVHSKRPLSASK